MNSFQIIAIFLVCSLIFAALLGALALIGVPVLIAVALVYLTTLWIMLGMQRRARECADLRRQFSADHPERNHFRIRPFQASEAATR